MSLPKDQIEKFFAEYERRTNSALTESPVVDIEGVVCAFADCFIESSPKGIIAGNNNEEFRRQIPKGFEYYRSIGTRSMQVQKLEITAIDEIHSMAKVSWRAYYVKKDSSELNIDFNVTYFLKSIEGKLKIFCYITGDEEKAYRENGLIPQ
jgi:hypothetical protein